MPGTYYRRAFYSSSFLFVFRLDEPSPQDAPLPLAIGVSMQYTALFLTPNGAGVGIFSIENLVFTYRRANTLSSRLSFVCLSCQGVYILVFVPQPLASCCVPTYQYYIGHGGDDDDDDDVITNHFPENLARGYKKQAETRPVARRNKAQNNARTASFCFLCSICRRNDRRRIFAPLSV